MLATDSQFNRAVVPFNRLLALAFDILPLFLLDGGALCSLFVSKYFGQLRLDIMVSQVAHLA